MATVKSSVTTEESVKGHLDMSLAITTALMPVIMFEHEGIVTLFNSASEKLWGMKAHNVVGKNINILFETDPMLFVTDNIGGGREENILITAKGIKIPAQVTISEMGTNGSTIYTAFVQDITMVKKIESDSHLNFEKMRHAEEVMKETMQEVSIKQLEMDGQMNAINLAYAFIEFNLDGTVISANNAFLKTLKYTLEEVKGKHHKMFCEKSFVESAEYKKLWEDLNAGKSFPGEFKRIAKDGSEVWIQATYAPVLDLSGKPLKVIKIATDITEDKLSNANYQGQLEAISKAQAVIEFSLDGTIQHANENFLTLMEYSQQEVQGKHHSMFVDPVYGKSQDYKDFWAKLNKGEFISDEFKRIGKGGKEVWIQASYNPIMDLSGKPFKVVKYATDITNQKMQMIEFTGQLSAISRSSAVIELDMNGNVLTVNELFENIVGYSLNEIKGKHHRTFCDEEYTRSPEYKEFWAKLNRGEPDSGSYSRIGKGGKQIFIQASYNPILDMNGKPYKVIKIAYDTTEFTMALKAVSKFVGSLKDGQFEDEINVKSSGDIGKMIEDTLSLRNTLRNIIENVNTVVRAAGENGNLNARLELKDVKGAWKDLSNSLNRLLESISEPVLEFNSIISEMAKGDLTRKFEMKSQGDIKDMGIALNAAIDNINQLLTNIGMSADVVATSSMSMLKKSESMKNNTTEVASAISQMAKGAQDQALKTDESSKLVEQVLKSANEMERKSNLINKAAEKGQKSTDDGLKTMKHLVRNMTSIKDSAAQTSKSIGVLGQRAEEIGRTLNVITDIASQTNLLALNAAIEAARAGDAGRGFAVVAEEIRKLAEDSRKSAVDIEKIISDVQKDTAAAGKAIDIMEVSVKEGNTATDDAENIFQEIAKSSEETFSFSKEIQDATVLQKTSIDLVVKNIEQIVVVAEETAAGSQQVASSSQQLNGSMADIADSSNKLSEIAAELQTGVNRFKLRKTSK